MNTGQALALAGILVLLAVTLAYHLVRPQRLPRLMTALILAELFGLALFFRVALPFDQVFGGEWLKFTRVDAYHYMRLADNLAHNFPHLTAFDPYFIYPGGNAVGPVNATAWLIAGVAWLVGLGAPTELTVNLAGIYLPALLGALTVVPVYFIGRELFGRKAGFLGAGIIALSAGEFLGRSIIGAAEQHVAEVFFTTLMMLLFIMALKSARGSGVKLAGDGRWPKLKRPLLYSLLGGLCLTLYLYTWLGALLFVFIIAAYLLVQFVIDHLRGEPVDYLLIVSVPFFLLALVLFAPRAPGALYWVPLAILLVMVAGLYAASRLAGRLVAV